MVDRGGGRLPADLSAKSMFKGSIDFGTGAPIAAVGTTDGFVATLRGTDGSAKPSDGGWAETFGSPNLPQQANDVALGPMGPIVVGDFKGTVTFGSTSAMSKSSTAGFCAVLDGGSGMPFSVRAFADSTDSQDVHARSIAVVNAVGDYAISGDFGGTIDFGGGMVQPPSGTTSAYVVSFDPQNAYKWSHAYLTSTFVGAAVDLGADPKGNVIIAGTYNGSIDFGAGPLTSTPGNLRDMYLAKLDPSGKQLWAKSFNGGKTSLGRMRALPTGEELMAGGVQGPVDFGTGMLPYAGGGDAFVAKFGL